MKFFYAKKELTCKHCTATIERGEVCVRTSHRNKLTGAYYGFIYHYECYLIDYCEKIRKSALYWIQQQVPPQKLGRPKIYKDGKKVHRLKALIRYHREAGNEDRVEELRRKLEDD